MRNYVDLIVLVPLWRVYSNIFLASYWSAGLGTVHFFRHWLLRHMAGGLQTVRQGQGKLIDKTPLTLCEAPAASPTTFLIG
jgi:hypothetical protein